MKDTDEVKVFPITDLEVGIPVLYRVELSYTVEAKLYEMINKEDFETLAHMWIEVHRLYTERNAKYKDTWREYKKATTVPDHIIAKMGRFINLLDNPELDNDSSERAEDTCLDTSLYALLALIRKREGF